MRNRSIENNGAITLIALVITIIILLVLAGVTIVALTGDNGILRRASEASEKTEIANEQEKVKLSVIGAIAENSGGEITRINLNKELTSYIGTEGIDYTLSEAETAPFVVTYTDSGKSYLIDENGNVSEYVDIAQYVKVGDYVDYNPTVSDKNGTQVEASKLTYTSPTGRGTEHGNGYTSAEEGGGQKFTATADTKWRILDIGNGTVTLISENPITTDVGENFIMKGAIGYLYAEQELNEVCKIYGFGYGADTSQVTKYNYGGPTDGDLVGEITGSGARSITIEDVNKQSGITEEDYIILDRNYGSTTNPITNIYYPTINTSNGSSVSAEIKNLKYTYYLYDNSEVSNADVQNILFKGAYWLASRCIDTSSSSSSFFVRRVVSRFTNADYFCWGLSSNLQEFTSSACAVRPVVILKSDVIDTTSSTEYNGETMWILK